MSRQCFVPSRRSSLVTCLTLACSALTLGVTSSDAMAQPSPFDAYEGKKQVEKTQQVNPNATPVVATAAPCDCKDQEQSMYTPLSQGQLVFDVRTALSATLSNNETEGGGTVRNSTFFARFSPGLGYFIRDNLEVGGSAGVMWRRIGRAEDDFSTSRDFLFEAKARYHYSVTPRFTLIPGLSLGGYLGRSERQVIVTQDGMIANVDETTRTSGGAATLSFDAGYLVKERISINAGVGFIGLLGTERIGSLEERFRVSTLNSSLNLGVVYAF